MLVGERVHDEAEAHVRDHRLDVVVILAELVQQLERVLVVAGVRLDDARRGRAGVRERLDDVLVLDRAPAMRERHGRALLRELDAGREADAHRAAGDDDGLSLQIISHRTVLRWA
jgi:hypothetical protein